MRKKKVLSCLLVPLLSANLLLSGCSRTANEPVTKSGFYFNTVISVSIYEKGSEELLDDCFALAQKYEGYFSNTIPDSDISKINDAGGAPVTVHDETIELLKTGISYGDLSGGKFDITIGRLSDLWDISTKALLDQTDASMIPSDADIQAALATVDYREIQIDGNTVTLQNPDARRHRQRLYRGSDESLPEPEGNYFRLHQSRRKCACARREDGRFGIHHRHTASVW